MNERIAEILCKSSDIMRLNAEIQRPYREAQLAKRRKANAKIVRSAESLRRHAAKRYRDVVNGRADVPADVLADADRLCAQWRTDAEWQCSYCGKTAERANRCADHERPLSDGGKHEPSNLRRACRSCNSRKGARTVWFA